MAVPFKLGRGDRRFGLPHGAALLFACLLIASLVMRIYALGTLPGLNGDEAWYGIAALEFLDGRRFGMITPNGNMLGPLQFAELVLLHLMFEPSVAVLRIPALLSSLGAIALAYLAGKRIGGAPIAWPAMLIMALLPINIAYARFGWDPSHSGLLVLLATCLLLGGSRIGSAFIFAASLLVHPTNLFAAPFLLMIRVGQAYESKEGKVTAIGSYTAMLLAGLAAYYGFRAGSDSLVNWSEVVRRLTDPFQYAEFARLFGDLLTGETAYRYLAGRGMGAAAAPLAWLTVALLILLAARRLSVRGLDVKQGLLLGWLASVASFFVLAGPEAIRPGVERYGFVLIAPTALAVAVMIEPWTGRNWLRGLSGVAGAAALAGFCLFLIVPLRSGQDEAHRAFWTGAEEPKVAAAEALKSFAARGPIDLMPEDFWLYMPARYLLHHRPVRLRWRLDEPALDASGAPGGYWLVWRDSEAEQRVRLAGRHRLVWASEDPRGRQVRIWQPK